MSSKTNDASLDTLYPAQRTEQPVVMYIRKSKQAYGKKSRSSSQMGPKEIRNIYFSDNTPEHYDPKTCLVVPDMPCSSRDESLGAFLAAWNKVERINEFLIGAAMSLDLFEAGPITAMGLNIGIFYNIVAGMAYQNLDTEGRERVEKYLDRLKNRNSKRNRIVHASWAAKITIGLEENDGHTVESFEWLRMYTPESPRERKKLTSQDPAAIAKYGFTIFDIQRATSDLNQFAKENADLPDIFGTNSKD